jgi:hypothetical protein
MKSMKTVVLWMVLVGAGSTCQAQLFDEWFRQKATQKKYLLQQIAGLQIYISFAEKGYQLAQKGLTTISDIKRGHFNLDQDFFKSLALVNPSIKNDPKVKGLMTINRQIQQQYEQTIAWLKQGSHFSQNEMFYVQQVLTAWKDGSIATTNELTDLVTNGKLQLRDDERIKRIDACYKDMQDRFAFGKSFSNELQLLELQREKEQREVDELRSFNER